MILDLDSFTRRELKAGQVHPGEAVWVRGCAEHANSRGCKTRKKVVVDSRETTNVSVT